MLGFRAERQMGMPRALVSTSGTDSHQPPVDVRAVKKTHRQIRTRLQRCYCLDKRAAGRQETTLLEEIQMTCIAWDGQNIAADRQSTYCGARITCTKLFKIDEVRYAATSGTRDCGLLLIEWYRAGSVVADWPQFQSKEDFTNLIVVEYGELFYYSQEPIKLKCEDKLFAMGNGREFALGAMEFGANAMQAVEIANKHSTGCGLGVDHFTVGQNA